MNGKSFVLTLVKSSSMAVSDRPILKISLTPADKNPEVAAVLVLILLWLPVIFPYSKLPGTTRYDEVVEKAESVSREPGAKGEEIEAVTTTISQAATDPGNRLRYAVGAPGPPLLRL
jgi:hypothetical protein